MNKDHVTGKGKSTANKAQAETGIVVGNSQQEVNSRKLQVEGKMQETLGNAKAFVKDTHQATKETLHMHR